MKIIAIYFTCIFFIIGCSLNEPENQNQENEISLVASYDLDIPEPSGLTYDPNTQTLWTVNDPPTNQIYNISLNGELLRTLDFVGDDLEGVAFDVNTNSLWVAEEVTAEIINISLQGEELQRVEITCSTYNPGSGFEGLCLGSSSEFYLLKEKSPGLFIQVNQDFSNIQETELTFANDYSGIFYDETRDGFWIVSDESEKLYLWDLVNGVREEHSLNFPKAEGVVFVAETNTFYIVSDSEQKLYVFNYSFEN